MRILLRHRNVTRVASLVLFTVLLLFAGYLFLTEPISMVRWSGWTALVVAFFLVTTAWRAYRTFSTIDFEDPVFTLRSLLQTDQTINIHEIAHVSHAPGGQKLSLYDSSGRIRFVIEETMIGYNSLFAFLREQHGQFWPVSTDSTYSLKRSLIARIYGSITVLLAADVWLYISGDLRRSIVGLVLVLLLIWTNLRRTHSFSITVDGLAFRSPIKSRRVPFDSIRRIELVKTPYDSWALAVYLSETDIIQIRDFRLSEVTIFDQLSRLMPSKCSLHVQAA